MSLPSRPPSDILIIGAGPAGLHAAFYAALRGLSVRLLDAQPEAGGQLSALYPDKVIYDVPGLPARRAADVVAALVEQLAPFEIDFRFGELARELERAAGGWLVSTDQARYPARAVILAAGTGALRPRVPRLSGQHPDVRTDLPDPATLHGKSVLIVGGVPQATGAALALAGAGVRVTLTHRRALFRGSPAQLQALETLRATGAVTVYAPAELGTLDQMGAWLTVAGERQHSTHQHVAADLIYVAGGVLPDLKALQHWPLGWQGEYVPADERQQTNLPGVFVAGDVSLAGSDFKLISLGLAQAARAANQAVHFVRPELRASPGHSSDRRLPTR